jgi:hypothetical protein
MGTRSERTAATVLNDAARDFSGLRDVYAALANIAAKGSKSARDGSVGK